MVLYQPDPDWWIELESTYRERVEQIIKIYEEHRKKAVDCLQQARPAFEELVEMVIQYVTVRYPKQFEYEHSTDLFTSHVLRATSHPGSLDPWVFLLENIPEDFILAQRSPESGEKYILGGGITLSAIGWNMSTKIGKTLREIHEPVPDYEDKLAFSIDRYFDKLTTEKHIQRGAWTWEIGQPLFLLPSDPDFLTRNEQSSNLKLSDIHVRVDWQTLRRLPKNSDVIIFNYKALFTPIENLREEPCIPRLLLNVLSEAKESLLAYKGTWHVEHIVKPALASWAMEQEEKALMHKAWEVRTLDEAPFFPGWREKWKSCYRDS